MDISERPAVVERKRRLGDWEADTIVGRRHRGAIVSLVDHALKLTLLARVKRKTAEAVGKEMVRLLRTLSARTRTITADNGKEFAGHALVSEEPGSKFYFARPYHSWERGLNEHTNGLVRGCFPKGTDFLEVTDGEVRARTV